MRFTYSKRKMAKLFTNSGDPDQTLHSGASDLGLHCLPITIFLGVSWLQWVNITIHLTASMEIIQIIPWIHKFWTPQNLLLVHKPSPISGLIQQMTKWWYSFLFFPENRIWHYMQIVSNEDNLHWRQFAWVCQNLFSEENKKNISI